MECHQHDYHTFIPPKSQSIHALCRRCGHVLFEIDIPTQSAVVRRPAKEEFNADKLKKETHP